MQNQAVIKPLTATVNQEQGSKLLKQLLAQVSIEALSPNINPDRYRGSYTNYQPRRASKLLPYPSTQTGIELLTVNVNSDSIFRLQICVILERF